MFESWRKEAKMGMFGYSGAFKDGDGAHKLANNQEACGKWADRWASLAAAKDGSLEDIKVDAQTLQHLYDEGKQQENYSVHSIATYAASVFIWALLDKSPGGEAAACLFLDGASNDFWKALRASRDTEPEGNLLYRAMKLGATDLALRLVEKGWSAESFQTNSSQWRPSYGSGASFAGPWSALFWTEPAVAERFEQSWSKLRGANAPALPEPIIAASLMVPNSEGKRAPQELALGAGMSRLLGGSAAALREGERSKGLVDAVASVPDEEWMLARVSGIGLFSAIENYKCGQGDALAGKNFEERLAAIGQAKRESSSRQAWIAVLFDAMIGEQSSQKVVEAAAIELARCEAGQEDKTLSGESLAQAWDAISGSGRGLAIARAIGMEAPWATPAAKPMLSEGVNASEAFQKMVERLEERPSNYGLSSIEAELALTNGDFSWGWRDAQGITPLIAVCSAAPPEESAGASGLMRPSEAEFAALAILERKGARESLDAQTEGLGFTALMLAVDRGYNKFAEALIDAGADPRVKDFQGRTAMDRTGARLAVRLGVKMGRAIKALEANESARQQLDGFSEAGLVDVAAKRRQRAAYPEAVPEQKLGMGPQ